MIGILIRRWPREGRYTQEESHVTTEDWRDASTGQGGAKIASKPPETERGKEGFFYRFHGSMAL